jgi:aspartyl/glutamyl-tRNA(Asn/Gln) amidotransferase C subunit
MATKKFTSKITKLMARLSKLTIDPKEEAYFTKQFNETLDIIQQFNKISTSKVKETSQVTGLENVFREDEIDEDRMLTQDEALSGTKNKHKGYFVVKSIFK